MRNIATAAIAFIIFLTGCQPKTENPQSAVTVPVNASQSPPDISKAIDTKELAKCSGKDNSIQRLTCFDELAKKFDQVSKTIDTTSGSKGAWTTSTDTDPLNDKSIHFAQINATEGKGRFGEQITMTVRCKNGKTEAYIDWASFLGSDDIKVTSRIDKSPASTSFWSISTNHKASFMPQAVTILKKFIGANSFVVNLTPYGESPVTAFFDISGSESAFADIRRDCKW